MFTQITETTTTPQTMTMITTPTKGAAHNLEDFTKRQKQNQNREVLTCNKCQKKYFLTSLNDALICPRCGNDPN